MKGRHRLEQGVRGKKLALGQCRRVREAGSSWRRKDGTCKLRRLGKDLEASGLQL